MSELARIIPLNDRLELVDVDGPSLDEIVSTPSESEIQAQADIPASMPSADVAEPTIQPDLFVPESDLEPTELEGIIGPQPEPEQSSESMLGVDENRAFEILATRLGQEKANELLNNPLFYDKVAELGYKGEKGLRQAADSLLDRERQDEWRRGVEERLGEVPGSPQGDAVARLNARLDRMEAQEREQQQMIEAEARDAQMMGWQTATHKATFEAAWSRANGSANVPIDQWVAFMSQAGPGALQMDPQFLAQLAVKHIPRTLPDGSTLSGRGPTATRTFPPLTGSSSARPESSELSRILNFEEHDGT